MPTVGLGEILTHLLNPYINTIKDKIKMSKYQDTEYTKRAKANYNAKALRSTTVQFMPKDEDALHALDRLVTHYGSVAKAVKAALLAHDSELNGK